MRVGNLLLQASPSAVSTRTTAGIPAATVRTLAGTTVASIPTMAAATMEVGTHTTAAAAVPANTVLADTLVVGRIPTAGRPPSLQ